MKLLFTDLDGTLLNNDSQVSPGTKAFLDDFLQAGNKLILSSGRPLLSILEVKGLKIKSTPAASHSPASF